MRLLAWVRERWNAAAEERRARDAARAEYQRRLGELSLANHDPNSVTALVALQSEARLAPDVVRAYHGQAFRRIAEEALADDILSLEEEEKLLALGASLGVDAERLRGEFRDLFHRLMVARVNDGRLPELAPEEVSLILKRGEVAHAIVAAELMKEVAVREYQGGGGGFSFRIARGVRYHTGRTRGRSVVVGTKLVAEDTGFLTITSRRCVFTGNKKTLEFLYSKLVDIAVFTDGIRFHVSNRQNASLFKVESGDVVAALVNAAAQRLE